MYEGWLALGGEEIANAERTAAYVRNVLPQFPLKNCTPAPDLPSALGDEPYTSPLNDGASWIDPSDEATYRFYGVYPLSIEGLQDSTATADVTQSIGSGGYNGIPRDATREVRVKALLIGADELALDAGMAWLKNALRGGCSRDEDCTGATLCYFADAPEVTKCYGAFGAYQTEVLRGVSANGGRSVGIPPRGDRRVEGVFSPYPGSDGFTWRWGVGVRGTLQDAETYGPVTPQRTNVARNPRFKLSLNGWSVTGGTAQRLDSGAVDGGPYAQFAGNVVVRTNIADAPFGDVQISVDVRSVVDQVVTLSVKQNADGTVVTSQTFNVSSSWSRLSMATAFARDTYLEVSGSTFDLSRLLVEGATYPASYFDGDTLGQMPNSGVAGVRPEYRVSWLGTPGESLSRMVWLGEASYTYCGDEFYSWVEAAQGIGNVSHRARWAELLDATVQAVPYERHMNDVVCIEGPTIREKYRPRSAGLAFEVEFILSAATPYAFSTPTTLLDLAELSLLSKQTWVDLAVPVDPVSVINDPSCPTPPSAPRAPAIVNTCVDGPGVWDRYTYVIPDTQVAVWQKMLPTLVFDSALAEYRQVRVRFTPNPFSWPVSTESYTNLIADPSPQALTLFGALNGPGGLTNLSRLTVGGYPTATVTWTSATTALPGGGIQHSPAVPVNSNFQYTFGIGHIVSSVGQRLVQIIDWSTSSGTALGSTQGTPFVVGASTTTSTAMTVTPPSGANRYVMRLIATNAGGSGGQTWPVGASLSIAHLYTVRDAVPPMGYFSGSSAPSSGFYYGWSGAPNGSTSIAVKSLVDPYSWCSELVLSYLPPNTSLTVDGEVKRASASVNGAAAITASNLLYASDGGPMIWPELSCGVPYLMTIDVPPNTPGDTLAVSLTLTKRE